MELTHGCGDQTVPDVEDTVDLELHIGIGDANALENTRDVVRNETVARPLREETSRNQDDEPVTVALGLEDLEPASLLSLLLDGECLPDLLVFQLDNLVVGVTFSVNVRKNGESLLVLTLRDVPTRRLRNEPNTGDLDKRWQGLDDGGDTPSPLALDVVGAICEPGCDNRSDIPRCVVDGREDGAVLRVANLSDEERSRSVGNGDTQTEEEASGDEHLEVD